MDQELVTQVREEPDGPEVQLGRQGEALWMWRQLEKKVRDEGEDWAGKCWGKMMKGNPLWQEVVRGQGPSSLQSAQAGPRPRSDKSPAEWTRQWVASLSEVPLAPCVKTESSHSYGLCDFTSRSVSCSYYGPGDLKSSFFVPFSERGKFWITS